MSNTSKLYDTMNGFIRTRAANRAAYLETMRRIDGYKGSAQYQKEAAAARAVRDNADAAARMECANSMNAALKAMQEAGERQKLTPPTQEQLAILQTLKLRSTFSESDFTMAANSMDGNPIALAALNDIADDLVKSNPDPAKRHHMNYNTLATGALSGGALSDTLQAVASACRSIMMGGGAVSTAVTSAKIQAEMYGRKYDEDSLPQWEPFDTEAAFYQYCVPTGTAPEAFTQAVNE